MASLSALLLIRFPSAALRQNTDKGSPAKAALASSMAASSGVRRSKNRFERRPLSVGLSAIFGHLFPAVAGVSFAEQDARRGQGRVKRSQWDIPLPILPT
jgi:hypothetical protein